MSDNEWSKPLGHHGRSRKSICFSGQSRSAIAQFFRQVLTDYPQVQMRNCAILTFDYEDGKYDLLSVVDPVNREILYQQQS